MGQKKSKVSDIVNLNNTFISNELIFENFYSPSFSPSDWQKLSKFCFIVILYSTFSNNLDLDTFYSPSCSQSHRRKLGKNSQQSAPQSFCLVHLVTNSFLKNSTRRLARHLTQYIYIYIKGRFYTHFI